MVQETQGPALSQLLSALAGLRGRTLFTFHSLGDADAVNSSIVLRDLVEGLSKSVCEARALDEIGGHAKKILKQLGIELRPVESLSGYSNIVLTDVSTTVLLGKRGREFQSFHGKKIVVDHHKYNTALLKADLSYIDGERSSSCEIVYQLMRLTGKKPAPLQATLLLAGILADTALFKSANPVTFEATNHLLKHSGKTYQEILRLVFPGPDLSERMASLKAAQRATVQKINGLLVGVSESSAFELQCASALVELGCDYAFVANRREGRISGVKKESLKGMGVGLVMERAGRAMAGAGGGHENVGGANGKKELVDAGLAECMQAVKEYFGKK